MAGVWIATGAIALVTATSAWLRRRGPIAATLAGLLSWGTSLVGVLWLATPLTAISTSIDSSAQPHAVQCGSTFGAFQRSPYVQVLDGDPRPEFDPAHAACQAAAWRKVAAVGTVELGLAAILACGALVNGRRRHDRLSDSEPMTGAAVS
jgi:hypothetical protein